MLRVIFGLLLVFCAIKSLCNFALIFFSIDSHHYGEKIATFYQHHNFGLKYYSDIMLVHGYLDVIPSWLSLKFFGNILFYSIIVAEKIVLAIFYLVNLVLSLLIFRKDKLLAVLASGVFIYAFNIWGGNAVHSITFALFYLILLKYYRVNSSLWFIFFYATSFFMLTYHTTVGTACFVASLPLVFRKIKDNPKQGSLFCLLSLFLTYIIGGDSIAAYFEKAGYYLSSNLYSFGNFFSSKFNLSSFLVSILGYLAVPFFIIKALFTKNKNIFYLSIYAIILAFCLIGYSFGRLDSLDFVPRALPVSFIVVFVIFSYMSYLSKKNKPLVLFFISLMLFLSAVYNIYPTELTAYLIDNQKELEYAQKLQLKGSYLDLTNRGMNYLFSQRQAAVPYTSYFNIVNSNQAKVTKDMLAKNPPALILWDIEHRVSSFENNISTRINPIYKWVLLSKNYKLHEEPNALYLVYSPNSTFSRADKVKLDKVAVFYLNELPDAWGASMRTLPMHKVPADIKYDKQKEGFVVLNNIKPIEADLLYLEYESDSPSVQFSIYLNNLPNPLMLTTKKNKILVPLDNFPSWLLEDYIEEISISSESNFRITKIELYSRD